MGMQQAADFRAESAALHSLIKSEGGVDYDAPTQFKAWSLNAVLKHLHYWNEMAGLQLTDESELSTRLQTVMSHKGGMRGAEAEHFSNLAGDALLEEWRQGFERTADLFADADPKARLRWAGPDMSARSSITARLMETWAHGQEIYDQFGVARENEDRIKNIVVLGVNTFGWTYKSRDEPIPEPMPYITLNAPSGEIWVFGEESETDKISGSAEAFCQTVTQTRNVADTDLMVTGAIANDWMSKAQCFAGPPETPPAPGTRYTRERV